MSRIAQCLCMRERFCLCGSRRAARDAGHDGEYIAGTHRRCGRRKVSNVGLVEIHTHEAAQTAVVLHQVSLQTIMSCEQLLEHLTYCLTSQLERVATVGKRAQRSWNRNSHRHDCYTSLNTSKDSGCILDLSSSSTQLVSSAARPCST